MKDMFPFPLPSGRLPFFWPKNGQGAPAGRIMVPHTGDKARSSPAPTPAFMRAVQPVGFHGPVPMQAYQAACP